MSLEQYLWRVQRTDNGLYETEISATEPTDAPSDGGAINTDQTTILASKFTSVVDEGYVNVESSLADNQAIKINASNAAGGIDIDAGTGGITIDTTNAIHLGAGAAIDISNTAGNITLDTPALIDLNAQSGINIGNDSDAAPINVGTGFAARAITVGNLTGATSLTLRAGTGALTLSGGGNLEINSTGGYIAVGNGADNQDIYVGNAGSRVVNIGNTNASSAVNIYSGSWGLTIGNDASSGEIQIAASNNTGGSRIFQRWGTGGHMLYQPAHTALSNGNATLTIAQLLGELFTMTPSTARTLTLPTAALAVAGISGVAINDCIDFRIINEGTAANDPEIIIAMGTGGTSVGYMDVDPYVNNAGTYRQSGTGVFRLRFTNVTASSEAYTVYRIA
jgi:hypothetical protein